MRYDGVCSLRVGFVGRDGHDMDLDLALRENAISRKGRLETRQALEWRTMQTLKRNQSSLGWGQ